MAPRVRGYEVVLLPALQQMGCSGSNAGAAPAPGLAEAVQHAATSQRLALQGADLAELSALAQRLLEGVDRRRWCALRSFDEVR